MTMGHGNLPGRRSFARNRKRIHVGIVAMRPAPYFKVEMRKVHGFLMRNAEDVKVISLTKSRMMKDRFIDRGIMIAGQDYDRDIE